MLPSTQDCDGEWVGARHEGGRFVSVCWERNGERGQE